MMFFGFSITEFHLVFSRYGFGAARVSRVWRCKRVQDLSKKNMFDVSKKTFEEKRQDLETKKNLEPTYNMISESAISCPGKGPRASWSCAFVFSMTDFHLVFSSLALQECQIWAWRCKSVQDVSTKLCLMLAKNIKRKK